jgi:hypothetical protein
MTTNGERKQTARRGVNRDSRGPGTQQNLPQGNFVCRYGRKTD